MDRTDRFITLAIHTYNKAQELKKLLESEGIETTLQNVNLSQPCIAAGVRVRIKESDLAFALRIVENPDVFYLPENQGAQGDRVILVPVDFSLHSNKACDIAFSLAFHQNASIRLLHTYTDPYLTDTLQLSESLSYDLEDNFDRKNTQLLASHMLNDFTRTLKEKIKNGELPPVTFTGFVAEGIPEEIILKTARDEHPMMIVMGTRGADAKERELVGSVTAEVLDSSRVPVLTVPSGNNDYRSDLRVSDVMMFVNFDQEDFLALDALHRFLPPSPDIKISFVNLQSRPGSSFNAKNYHGLLNYAEVHYPECHFSVSSTTPDLLIEQFSSGEPGSHPELIVVPNRRRNMFARLFNPGMAHRLLFHADIPMMVLPV